MANTPLTGNTISSSYQGLLKTGDSTALGATEKPVVDGLANASTMTMGTGGVSFTSGTVDFTGATVTGLPAGAAGLESGTGTDSMQSAASLTTTAANASGDKSLSLGNGAESPGTGAIAIGDGADTGIGADSYDNNNTIAIGVGANIANYTSGIAIGKNAATSGAFGFRKTAIGTNSSTSAQDAISLGTNTSSTATGAVALGSGVTAATADTVSVKALEVQTDSTPTAGGIIMSDAGGTDRRINIDATGGLQIDSTPVGGGGDTPAMSLRELPQFALNSFGAVNVDYVGARTWVSTTGFSTGSVGTNALNDTNVGFAIFSMQPGEVLEGIQYFVSVAGAAGAVVNIGIYELDYRTWAGTVSDQPSGVVLGDKIKDFGSFAATTTGQKDINVSASPFTMPTTSKYGAIALAFSTNDNTTRIASWSNAVWDTYSAANAAGTSYRMVQPYAENVTTGGALPANLAGNSIQYKAETSNPVWAFIQTKN